MKLFKCIVTILLIVCAFVIVNAIAQSIPDDMFFGNKPKAWVDPILATNRYIILIASICIIMINQINLKQKFDMITMMIITGLLCLNIGGFIIESEGFVIVSFLLVVLILMIRQFVSWQMSIKACSIATMAVNIISIALLTVLALLNQIYMLFDSDIYIDISIGIILSLNILIVYKLHQWFASRNH